MESKRVFFSWLNFFPNCVVGFGGQDHYSSAEGIVFSHSLRCRGFLRASRIKPQATTSPWWLKISGKHQNHPKLDYYCWWFRNLDYQLSWSVQFISVEMVSPVYIADFFQHCCRSFRCLSVTPFEVRSMDDGSIQRVVKAITPMVPPMIRRGWFVSAKTGRGKVCHGNKSENLVEGECE